MNYPMPDNNPHCQCKGNPQKAFFCQHGHMLECHYPYDCKQAACSHLHKYDFQEGEINALEETAKQNIREGNMPQYGLDENGNILIKNSPTNN